MATMDAVRGVFRRPAPADATIPRRTRSLFSVRPPELVDVSLCKINAKAGRVLSCVMLTSDDVPSCAHRLSAGGVWPDPEQLE